MSPSNEHVGGKIVIIIIIKMVISKCYFAGEHIALSINETKKKKKQQRCEHRIMKSQQIKSTVHDEN